MKLVLPLLVLVPLVQSPVAAPPAAALERVVVIGASVSDGYKLEARFDEVIEAMITVDHEPVTTSATSLFFTNAPAFGEQAVDFALAQDPTLVVAVDFLFWFGYGARTADGRRLVDEAKRLELLEVGLALLERFDCPIVVGDFPNMSDAVGRGMLRAIQQPRVATLTLLTNRVVEWASERDNVTVLKLSEIVARMRGGEAFSVGRHRWPEGAIDRVLQRDRLHPTIEGLAALGHAVGLALLEAGLATEDELAVDLVRLMDELGEEFEDAPAPVEDGAG